MKNKLTKAQIKQASKKAQAQMDKRLNELKVENPEFYKAIMRFRNSKIFIPNKLGGDR